MIWFITFKLYFCLSYITLQNFISLGGMYHCQLWLKTEKRWKLLNPLKFPNLLTFSDSPFIPVSGVFEFFLGRPVIMFIPSVSHHQMCLLLFLQKDYLVLFVSVYLTAYGNQDCMRELKENSWKTVQACRLLLTWDNAFF